VKKGVSCYIIVLICSITLLFTGCKINKRPTVETVAATEIEPDQAMAGGKITDDGNKPVTVKGVCWSTSKSPSAEDPKTPRTTDGYGTGDYTSKLTGLLPNTLYYYRAYAINREGIGYGNQLSFTTTPLSVAILTTTQVSQITQISAVSGGDITFDGGSDITDRGVCWSTHSNPTTADSTTSDGLGTGAFSSNITGLTGNTTYHVRAFAINDIGIAYGQDVSFTSAPLVPVVITSNPSPTGTTTATGGGNITSDGGSEITERGVCWSTSVNPTISGNKTSDGTGTGVFTSSLTGLQPNTRYHVRAFATNSVGTSYGTDKTFYSDPVSIRDFDDNEYGVIRIGTQLWISENLKTTHFNDGSSISLVTGNSAWSNLSGPGYCWYGNTDTNKDIYGALYNWYSVDAGNLCPAGWHVASDDDWLTLEIYLGGSSPAGGELKETGFSHWASPNEGATNDSKFTALPGGWRLDNGTFEFIGNYGLWWTSTEYSSSEAWFRRIQYDQDKVFRSFKAEKTGMSVRCIKD
jgi:uncharacterized protein (TIGR02145 family)